MSTAAGPARGAWLDAERDRIERRLRALLQELLSGAPKPIAAPIRYAVGAGGKRLRPVLCLAAYRAAGGTNEDAACDVACAVELLHTYSLVHDDLPCMDDDDLRRGQPTTHRVFGVPAATVAGAAMIPLAFRALARGAEALGLTARERSALVAALATAAGAAGMVGGQLLDLEAEGRRLSLEELEDVHRRKTGALLGAALRAGALAARASQVALRALDEYGRALGLAFQIADDVLDITASAAVLGKTPERDQALGKATFPGLMGIEAARARAREEAGRAVRALETAGLATPELVQLARYAVERDR